MNLMVDVSTVTTHTQKKKTYSRYMEFIEKGIKAYHCRKLSNHKRREQERTKGKKKLQNNQKIINKWQQ